MLGRTLGKIYLLNCLITVSAIVFSARLDGSTFTSIWGVSLKECRTRCEARLKCQSVNYSRRRLECQLNTARLSGYLMLTDAPGFVYTEIDQLIQNCGGRTCSKDETCVDNRAQGTCDITECDVPVASPAHGNVYGNINKVGNKVKLECDVGYELQTDQSKAARERGVISDCLSTGLWDIPSFQCVECDTRLVTGPDGIEDSGLTASSWHGGNYNWTHVRHSRLMTQESYLERVAGAWSALTDDEHQYVQAEFTAVKAVRAIQTQGRNSNRNTNQWTTKYKIGYSADCHSFTNVTDTSGAVKIFPGNVDRDTVVTNRLDETVQAKCIRLYPVTWRNHIALRFELIGCKYDL